MEQVEFFVLDNKLKGGCIAADPATRGDHDTLLNLREEHECKIRCAWQRSCVAYEFATLTNTFTRCALHRSPVDVGFPSQDSVSSVCYLKRLDGWTGQPEWMQRITIADATPPPFPPPPPPVDPCENIIFSPSAAEIAATPCLELVKPGAHLLDCKMNNADLRGADLTGGTIDHGELAGAQLQCAKLQGVYVTATSFEKANLSYSILDGAQFESNPVLKYASFRSASLEGTKFGAALLSGADFSRSNMHTAVLAYSEALDPVIFTDANLTGLVILDSVMPNSKCARRSLAWWTSSQHCLNGFASQNSDMVLQDSVHFKDIRRYPLRSHSNG
uniref:Uncharacterized protein n=1 Tax=Chrysotila carterae TaxID=13221 RepID=A0A6S9P2J2_CHRCT